MAYRFLLDTDIVSLVLRGHAPEAARRLQRLRREEVAISVITAMELAFGLEKHPSRRTRQAVELFLGAVDTAPLHDDACAAYGKIRAALERRGTPIGPLGTLIAAHAVALGATLITANLREFRRVPGLNVERWAGSS